MQNWNSFQNETFVHPQDKNVGSGSSVLGLAYKVLGWGSCTTTTMCPVRPGNQNVRLGNQSVRPRYKNVRKVHISQFTAKVSQFTCVVYSVSIYPSIQCWFLFLPHFCSQTSFPCSCSYSLHSEIIWIVTHRSGIIRGHRMTEKALSYTEQDYLCLFFMWLYRSVA